ncbi:MAG: HlyD family secretion protein [Polyangiaceae bacterium]
MLAASNREAARARLTTLTANAAQAGSRVAEASAKAKQTNVVEAIVDQARARAKAAHAEVATANALRDLAKLDLSYTRILAPSDGIFSKKSVSVGQNLAMGQAVGQLVTNGFWVTANFKETQVARMRTGQPASFEVDAFPGTTFTGNLESFSGATGSRFTLLPPDNATGNFTKVVQRVPLRVHVKEVPAGVALRPGMSVSLTIDTRG